MNKTIGILGGMGPEATVYFYDLIIKKTRAASDQEHIPTIIYSDPRVPPRTDAILETGPSPVPFLLEGAKMLILAGADFLVMPCLTAHYFLSDISSRLEIPFIHLIKEAAAWTKTKIKNVERVGLIASTGTLSSKLFQDIFDREGIAILTPSPDDQMTVMECIFGSRGIKAGFKTGESRDKIVGIANKIIERGAEAVIAGCTEIPLVLKPEDIPAPLIEPMDISAEVCIKTAGYRLKG
jgi:aspartate racemase